MINTLALNSGRYHDVMTLGEAKQLLVGRSQWTVDTRGVADVAERLGRLPLALVALPMGDGSAVPRCW